MSHWQRVNLHANPPTRRKWSIVNLVVDQQSTIDSRYNLDILPKKIYFKNGPSNLGNLLVARSIGPFCFLQVDYAN